MSFTSDVAKLRTNIARLDAWLNGAADATVTLGAQTRETLAGLIGYTAAPDAPSAPWPGRPWFDTSDPANPVLRIRDEANSTWIDILAVARGEVLSIATRSADHVLVASDRGRLIRMDVATANTVTIGTAAFAIGAQVHITQAGAGRTTIVAGAGVTVTSADTLRLRARHSVATAVKTAADTWLVFGDLEANT